MLRRVVLAGLAILMLLCLGCPGMLDAQAAKDRNLGHVVEESLRTSTLFQDNFESFSLVESGVYRCETTGLSTADDVGDYAYNVMVTLDERNNTLVRSGRADFRIMGEQDGQQIFEVVLAAGAYPRVTLMGPYEGIEWTRN